MKQESGQTYGTSFNLPSEGSLKTPGVKAPINNGVGMGQKDGGGSKSEPKVPSRSSK